MKRAAEALLIAGLVLLLSAGGLVFGLPTASAAGEELQPIGQKPEEETDIRRLFLRQTSVLLNPGEMEAEIDFNYMSNEFSSSIYKSRFRQFQVPLSFRIGLFSRAEGFLSMPLSHERQEISFADQGTSQTAKGAGDAQAGLNYEIHPETPDWPDIIAALSLKAPTGGKPGEAGLSTGSGHWAGTLGVQFIKTTDPIVLFWGVRYTHAFAASHYLNDGVHRVEPGDTAEYNFGFGFAVNDRVSLSVQDTGSYQWETRSDGSAVSGSATETASFRSALTFRISRQTYIEQSLSIGLNDDTPDFVVGFAATRRFGR